MARYSFNIRIGEAASALTGREFGAALNAQDYALELLRDLMENAELGEAPSLTWHVEVSDEAGAIVFEVKSSMHSRTGNALTDWIDQNITHRKTN